MSTWRQTWPWLLAGMLSGMAILTRATGVILVGVVGMALLIRLIGDVQRGNRLTHVLILALQDGLIWLSSTVFTIFLLLPALWVQPRQTLSSLWAWSSNAATEGHENPTFFRGIHTDDPGWLVYPTVLAWRTSPVEWFGIGILILLGLWGWRKKPFISHTSLPFYIVAIVFSMVYLLAMSMGAKKFDRYILPVFPIVTILAAQGLILGKNWLLQRANKAWRCAGYGLLIAGVLLQAVFWQGTRPYRLDYYNPVLGGASRAKSILQLGWGQGGDQVVDFLLEQSGGGPITVQTSAVPSAFTYFLETDSLVQFRSFSLRTPAGWFETDFYVAGIQQTQRGLAPQMDLFEGLSPVHSAPINGVSYFDVYAVRQSSLPSSLATPTACNLTFGGQVTLMQIIGRDNTIDFYFRTTGPSQADVQEFSVGIAFPDGTTQVHTGVLQPAEPGQMSKLTIPFAPSSAALADATLTLQVDSRAVTAPWLVDPVAVATTHSECFYTSPPP